MRLDQLAVDGVRAAVLLGSALVAVRWMRGGTAGLRRLVLVAAFGAALLAPAISSVAGSWRVRLPESVTVLGTPFAEPLEEGRASPTAREAAPLEREGAAKPKVDWRGLLVLLWALGAAAVLGRLTYGLTLARGMVRRASAVDPETWRAAIADAERETGVRARVRITAEVDAPAVSGLLAPVVLLPRDAALWTRERQRVVLLHELAHVRHKDCLAHALAQVVCALHWFDPLAWIAARRLRALRELAADDAVIAAGAKASAYAEELLAIAGIAADARTVPSGALPMAQPSEIGERIASILAPSRARAPLSRGKRALVAAIGLAATAAAACASPEPRQDGRGQASTPGTAATVAAPSTLSPATQALADEELERLAADWKAEAATILVLDPSTGEILANAGRAQGAPADVAIATARVPGSTFKLVTIAAALEEKAIDTKQRFDCSQRAYDGRECCLHDAAENGALDVGEIVAVSSNVGVSRIYDALGGERLGRWLRRFHFGEAPRVGVDGAASGTVPENFDDAFDSAVVAIGMGNTASPLQIAAAYATIANQGVYVAPSLTRRGEPVREKLLSPDTAGALLRMLEGAVNGERATGQAARIGAARVAGKTGTAPVEGTDRSWASFVGIVPADRPRFVVLVAAETATEGATGGKVAAPVFARVAARLVGR